jgi:transmembrane sensor
MNRYLNGPRLVAPDAAGVRISGLFNAGDMDAFISGVTGLFPVVAQRQADGSFRLQSKLLLRAQKLSNPIGDAYSH